MACACKKGGDNRIKTVVKNTRAASNGRRVNSGTRRVMRREIR